MNNLPTPYLIEYWEEISDKDNPFTMTVWAKSIEAAERTFEELGIEHAHYLVHEPILE